MSIIENAVKVKNDPDYRVTPNNPAWRCFSFTFKGKLYEVAFESDHYGDHARQFMIDGNFNTGVPSKYGDNDTVNFAQSSSLGGIREFEDGSINQEFLFTPLGLREPDWRKEGYRSEYYFLKTHLESIGIEVYEWTY